MTGRVALVALVTSKGPKPGVLDSIRVSVDRVFKGGATGTIKFADENVAGVMPAGSRWIILGDARDGVARGEYWRVGDRSSLPHEVSSITIVSGPGWLRRLLGGLAVVVVGGSLGWLSYEGSRPHWLLGNCTGTISTVPGVPAARCIPPPNLEIPPDLSVAIPSLVGGAMVALIVVVVVWLLATVYGAETSSN